MPILSLRLSRFLHSRRSRSQRPTQADSSHAVGVSRPSPQLGAAQQAQFGPVPTNQNITGDSAGQLNHDSPPATSLVEPISTQALGPHNSVAPLPIHPASPSPAADSGPSQHQGLLIGPPSLPVTGPQQPPASRPPTPLLHQPLQHPQDYVNNIHESRNVSVEGKQINYDVDSSNKFMAELLEKTIPGAAFDSSARDPPPRCHPGTRLAILAQCLEFISNAVGKKKIRWVFGSAGVGKSAIMQNIADSYFSSESPGASIFFSINGRNDGTKAIITLAYQLAARCEPYRLLIKYEITRDSSLLESSLSVQFEKFVVEPFIYHPQLKSLGRILIIIDGLDECDKSLTQRELLQLISDFCFSYPSSPIVWVIASRPEAHIASFFAQGHVQAVYEKEEVPVDSEEPRADVERFLRHELTRIQKEFSLDPWPRWLSEHDFWKLANASSGLFVYADTLVKYIGDPRIGKPTSRLKDVLEAIDAHPLPNLSPQEHPLARLDVLYALILSKVPEKIMKDTRKILLALVWDSEAKKHLRKRNFIVFCNWLGMTCDDAYAAIRHLSAVLDAPSCDEAHTKTLRAIHKSFIDYVYDFARSGFSPDIKHEADLLEIQCTFRTLEQAPDGVDFGDVDYGIFDYRWHSQRSVLARGPGTGGNISLAWPVGEEIDWNDNRTRLQMYKLAVVTVVEGIRKGESVFCTEFCIRLVTTRFHFYDLDGFPLRELRDVVFERSRRDELLEQGILKRLPAKVLDATSIRRRSRLQFRRPTATTTNLSDTWNLSCKHNRTGDWGEGQDEDWTTEFGISGVTIGTCDSCHRRLQQQLENWKTRSPEHLVTFLFTSTDISLVEFQFIDQDDGVSEWAYWFVYDISAEERRKLGSLV